MSREEPLIDEIANEVAKEVGMIAAHYELLRKITTATITTMLLKKGIMNEVTKARYEATKSKR
jgi:hypothetical protein